MHIGWVPDGTGGYRGQMAVLVKPNGLLGNAYMAAIRPFRHLIVYPPMLRQIERELAGARRRSETGWESCPSLDPHLESCVLAPGVTAAYGPGMASTDLSVLRGQRVLITGAARGIGAALAERLASHGARLALVGLEPETMAAVAARCGEGTFVAECDVSSNEQVTQAIDAAAEALGGLDVVVANAGIAAGGPLRSQDLRSWERVIEINLLGVMYTDRAALPHLERSGGYVLNIASTAAVLRGPGMSAYCAAKAGVEALSDCLRIEMQPLGVQVGVAYFLFLDTDMVRRRGARVAAAAAREGRDAARVLTHLPAASGDRRGRGRDRASAAAGSPTHAGS